MAQKQISVVFAPAQRDMIEKIAAKYGLTISAVVRQSAEFGLPKLVGKLKKSASTDLSTLLEEIE